LDAYFSNLEGRGHESLEREKKGGRKKERKGRGIFKQCLDI
jgi:hypothetical protein